MDLTKIKVNFEIGGGHITPIEKQTRYLGSNTCIITLKSQQMVVHDLIPSIQQKYNMQFLKLLTKIKTIIFQTAICNHMAND
jgi:hypothetical protein